MNTLGRVLLSFGLPILLGATFLGYVASRAKTAHTRVSAFCDSVELGSTLDGLADRAKAEGLSVHEFLPRDGKGALMVQDGVLLSRHFCTLDHEQARIVRKDHSSAH